MNLMEVGGLPGLLIPELAHIIIFMAIALAMHNIQIEIALFNLLFKCLIEC